MKTLTDKLELITISCINVKPNDRSIGVPNWINNIPIEKTKMIIIMKNEEIQNKP